MQNELQINYKRLEFQNQVFYNVFIIEITFKINYMR